MRITKRQLRRIIQEAFATASEQSAGDDGIADYYKRKEEERKAAYEIFMQALEKYEALPPNSPEKYKMESEVDRLKQQYYDAGYVGD